MGESLAQIVAKLPDEERSKVLADLDSENLVWDWRFWARPEQIAPDGDWAIWLLLAGRGFGKTRTAAEWVREEARVTADGQRRFASACAAFN